MTKLEEQIKTLDLRLKKSLFIKEVCPNAYFSKNSEKFVCDNFELQTDKFEILIKTNPYSDTRISILRFKEFKNDDFYIKTYCRPYEKFIGSIYNSYKSEISISDEVLNIILKNDKYNICDISKEIMKHVLKYLCDNHLVLSDFDIAFNTIKGKNKYKKHFLKHLLLV